MPKIKDWKPRSADAPYYVHGQTGSTEYFCWALIKQRCFNPKNPSFHRYGGRGITMCEEWRGDFAAFFRHMGNRPTPDHQIERIDNNGHYAPENCKWATRKEQANNRCPDLGKRIGEGMRRAKAARSEKISASNCTSPER